MFLQLQSLTNVEFILPMWYLSKGFCRVLDCFRLICHILHVTKMLTENYFLIEYDAYDAYRSLQKITNLMVRQLARPHFLESCRHVIFY